MTTSKPLADDEYYAARAGAASNATRVGWRDDVAQQRRFAALARILPAAPGARFSINDVGCGLGDFASYMFDAGYEHIAYTGIDHSSAMIAEASQRYRNDMRCRFFVAGTTYLPEADYAIASGIFSLRQAANDGDWLMFIHSTLERMNAASKSGFAFNALTSYSDPPLMRPELYYADPCALFDHCKRNFSNNVALLHDYDEYDFTILVRKAG